MHTALTTWIASFAWHHRSFIPSLGSDGLRSAGGTNSLYLRRSPRKALANCRRLRCACAAVPLVIDQGVTKQSLMALEPQLIRCNVREGKQQSLWIGASDKVESASAQTTPPQRTKFDDLDGPLYTLCYSKCAKHAYRQVLDELATPEECQRMIEWCDEQMQSEEEVGGHTRLLVADRYSTHATSCDFVDKIMDRIRRRVQSEHAPPTATKRTKKKKRGFTAPVKQESLTLEWAMFTRLRPGPDNMTAAEKPYWAPHMDKSNVITWDHSGVLYLTTKGEHFEGGNFAFLDQDEDVLVEPREGRLITFTSGPENLHQVRKVTSGTRYNLALFFGNPVRVILG